MSYTPEQSLEVLREAREYASTSGLESRVVDALQAYWPVHKLIPIPVEAMFKGTTFPWGESLNDFQVSYTLALFGLHKHARMALRSAHDLGLLSVYWNLDDNGHIAISNWIRGRESTPYIARVWKRILSHRNFERLAEVCALEEQFEELRSLHDYVHTKGVYHSNATPIADGQPLRFMVQRFSREMIDDWADAFIKTIVFIATCHLVRYPLGTVQRDWYAKFGIDIPSFGALETHETEALSELVSPAVFAAIGSHATEDPDVQRTLAAIDELPDMTKEESDRQLDEQQLMLVRSMGFSSWLDMTRKSLASAQVLGWASDGSIERMIDRVTALALAEGLVSEDEGKPSN